MTVAQLKTRTAKDLAAIAKRKGVSGWHAMRKEELIQALAKVFKAEAAAGKRNGTNGCSLQNLEASSKKNGNGVEPPKPRPARIERRLTEMKERLAHTKDLAFHLPGEANGNGNGAANSAQVDRLLVMVRDSYWLHAYWELTRASVERARAAMGQDWHGAKPVLRVMEVVRDGTTSSARKIVRDVEIHGRVNNWYVDVHAPPKSFQMEIGYLSLDGRFVSLAKSNTVTTPPAGTATAFEGGWSEERDDFDRIYALSGGYSIEGDATELRDLFEERLGRSIGTPMSTRFSLGACRMDGRREFPFEVDAELIVYGLTSPDAQVTLRGEPVRLQPDGTFAMRFAFPDRRQVLPVVASSGDGVEQRTIVLAVERNTKVMEPMIREPEA